MKKKGRVKTSKSFCMRISRFSVKDQQQRPVKQVSWQP